MSQFVDEESGDINYDLEIYEINWAFWAIIFVSVLLGVVFSLLAILLIRPCMNFYRRVFWEYEIGKGVYKKLDENDYDERRWELEIPKPRRRISPGPKSADPRTGEFPYSMSPLQRAVSYHNRSQSNEIRPSPHRRGASAGGSGAMGLGISEKPNSYLHPP